MHNVTCVFNTYNASVFIIKIGKMKKRNKENMFFLIQALVIHFFTPKGRERERDLNIRHNELKKNVLTTSIIQRT